MWVERRRAVVDLVHEYRGLIDTSIHGTLSRGASYRLRALRELFTPSHSGSRESARLPVDLEGRVRLGRVSSAARITDLDGRGARIVTDLPLGAGQSLVVTISDDRSGAHFRLPAIVRWRRDGQLGVRFIDVSHRLYGRESKWDPNETVVLHKRDLMCASSKSANPLD